MNIKPIKTKKDYEAALKKIDMLFDAKPNTLNGDLLEILVTLVEAYEQKNFKIFPPDPIEAIKFRMDQLGLKQSDIAKVIGGDNGQNLCVPKVQSAQSVPLPRQFSDGNNVNAVHEVVEELTDADIPIAFQKCFAEFR